MKNWLRAIKDARFTKAVLMSLWLGLPSAVLAAGEPIIPLLHYKADIHDQASLQRGAKMFMNYCSGCHSLQYIRYNAMGRGIGLVDDKGEVLDALIKDNLIFTGAPVTANIRAAMTEQEAALYLGMAPPDLTLVARVRGPHWLYTYLRTFYVDKKRPWGANNLAFQDVAMPNVLLPLQGEQIPVYVTETIKEGDGYRQIEIFDELKPLNNGKMSPEEFDGAVRDLVNFLTYVSEPAKAERLHLGVGVLLFLLLLIGVTYMLKREYWKQIH